MDLHLRSQQPLEHREVTVEGCAIHVVQGGRPENGSIVFLHGWPESWALFEELMMTLRRTIHVVAIDLPGIGASQGLPSANDKRTLARYVDGVIRELGLRSFTIAGHDAGGQIAYAYLRAFPNLAQGVAIMNTAVPGVEPWTEVVHRPEIWHFAFHSVPELPETLVAGHVPQYFDFFFDALQGSGGVSREARATFARAYHRPSSLRTGFDWYRAFAEDEKHNRAVKHNKVRTPVLYVRGEEERGDISVYLEGLKESGLMNVRGSVIPASGHFTPIEQPDLLAAELMRFVEADDGPVRRPVLASPL